MNSVQVAFRDWKAQNLSLGPEQWLRAIYEGRGADKLDTEPPAWHDVVQYILRRVVRPRNAHPGAYYYGICRPTDVNPDHRDFWQVLRGSDGGLGVVTLNYDILAEQALHGEVDGQLAPVFYYGGFQYNQHVQKVIRLYGGKSETVLVKLGHEVPIYKLHGSVNWAWEHHSETLKVHEDVRAAFRVSGTPAVVPPVEEKALPPDFTAIWMAAERELAKANRWVVCGYSAPTYDIAVRDLLRRAAISGPPKHIELIDPNAARVRDSWSLEGVTNIRTHLSIRDALVALEEVG